RRSRGLSHLCLCRLRGFAKGRLLLRYCKCRYKCAVRKTERAVGIVWGLRAACVRGPGKYQNLSVLLNRFLTLGALIFTEAADDIHGAIFIESPGGEVRAGDKGIQAAVFEEQVARIKAGRRNVSDQV